MDSPGASAASVPMGHISLSRRMLKQVREISAAYSKCWHLLGLMLCAWLGHSARLGSCTQQETTWSDNCML